MIKDIRLSEAKGARNAALCMYVPESILTPQTNFLAHNHAATVWLYITSREAGGGGRSGGGEEQVVVVVEVMEEVVVRSRWWWR